MCQKPIWVWLLLHIEMHTLLVHLGFMLLLLYRSLPCFFSKVLHGACGCPLLILLWRRNDGSNGDGHHFGIIAAMTLSLVLNGNKSSNASASMWMVDGEGGCMALESQLAVVHCKFTSVSSLSRIAQNSLPHESSFCWTTWGATWPPGSFTCAPNYSLACWLSIFTEVATDLKWKWWRKRNGHMKHCGLSGQKVHAKWK